MPVWDAKSQWYWRCNRARSDWWRRSRPPAIFSRKLLTPAEIHRTHGASVGSYDKRCLLHPATANPYYNMHPILHSALVSSLLLLCTGCLKVHSTVTRFHTLQHDPVPKTFRIIPLEQQRGSIEFAAYSGFVASKLASNGWHQVSMTDQPADADVYFVYGIDNGHTEVGSVPVYGQTSGGTAQTYGSITSSSGQYANYSATTYTKPTYGVVGSRAYSDTVYTRFLQLDIIDAQRSNGTNLVKFFEGRVRSSGSSSDVAAVLPTMIEALFKHFPGKSGKPENITLYMRKMH